MLISRAAQGACSSMAATFARVRARLGNARRELDEVAQRHGADSNAWTATSLVQCRAVNDLLLSADLTAPERAQIVALIIGCAWGPDERQYLLQTVAGTSLNNHEKVKQRPRIGQTLARLH